MHEGKSTDVGRRGEVGILNRVFAKNEVAFDGLEARKTATGGGVH
jgi:hypothetical protein